MAIVLNDTARQYNLKTVSGDRRITVRLVPGVNEVEKEIWECFANDKKVDPYVAELKKEKKINWGKRVDEDSFENEDEPVVAKTKSIKPPKKKK